MTRKITAVAKEDPYFRPDLVTVTREVVTVITRDNKVYVYSRTLESE